MVQNDPFNRSSTAERCLAAKGTIVDLRVDEVIAHVRRKKCVILNLSNLSPEIFLDEFGSLIFILDLQSLLRTALQYIED